MKINELAERAHAMAKEKGFYDEKRSSLEAYALMVSEIAEAIEEVRQGNPPAYYTEGTFTWGNDENRKPEGEQIELADLIIRALDYAGSRGWDMEKAIELKMKYNATRPHKHGKLL